jgi:pilus assembly protein Flp/PilA
LFWWVVELYNGYYFVEVFFPIILFRKEARIMLTSRTELGQGLVEYALILVLVALVVIAALLILGPVIGNTFSSINSSLSGL